MSILNKQWKYRKKTLWNWCCACVLGLSILCFTPCIIPRGEYQPMLLGMPRSLWGGILIAFAILGVSVISIYVYPYTADINQKKPE